MMKMGGKSEPLTGPRYLSTAAPLLFVLVFCAGAKADDAPPEPPLRVAAKHTQDMIVASHPLATDAGLSTLSRGGTAADAFVTVQSVLGLVEP